MALLRKQDILKADDIPTEEVPVPEWGGEVLVRGMTGSGRDEYFAAMTKLRRGQTIPDTVNATAKLCQRTIWDPDTDLPMFTDAEVYELGRKSASALHRVEQVAMRLSGLEEEDMALLSGKDSPRPEPSTTKESSTSGSRKTSGE
jgi:hypothetical protein